MPFVMLKPDQRARLKPCRRCGYSLRNNIDARNCPECGLAVWISLRDDDALEWSNPAWLRRLTSAVAVLAVAHVVMLGGLGYIAWGRQQFGTPWMFRHGLPVVQAIAGAAAFMVCAGAALLIGAEGRHPDLTRGRRRTLIVLAPLCVLAVAAGLLPVVANVPPVPKIRWASVPLAVLTTLCAWATLYEPVRRIPARKTSKLIVLLALGLAAGTFLMCVSIGPTYFLLRLTTFPWRAQMLPFTAACLVYVPLALGVLAYCWGHLRSAAREADKNWEADS